MDTLKNAPRREIAQIHFHPRTGEMSVAEIARLLAEVAAETPIVDEAKAQEIYDHIVEILDMFPGADVATARNILNRLEVRS